MEEKKVHIWTVIKYAGAFIAFMIGSGFASGQEIMQFFTSFGLWGVAGALISMFLFSWSGAVFMGRGFDHKDEKDFSPFRYYCGKYLGIFFEWFIPFFLFCVVVTMISGAGATVHQYFGLPTWVGSVAMAVLATLSVLLGLQKLIDIIGCLGPFTIIFTMIIAIYTLFTQGGNLAGVGDALANVEGLADKQAAPAWWIAGLLYVAYNATGSVPFFNGMGQGARSKREVQLGAIFGGVLLMLAAICVSLAMLCDIEHTSTLDIPILYLADFISPLFGGIFSIIIIGEIFSTAAPMLWVTANKLGKEGTTKHKIIVIVLGIVALLGGLLPFDVLVGTIYPYTGYLGIAFLIIVAVKSYIIDRKKLAK